jgi:hypothetical protein
MRFGSIIDDMVIDMNESQLKTVAQLRAFLAGTLEVKFQPIRNDLERYGFIAAVLGRFAYPQLGKADKGVLMLYLGAYPNICVKGFGADLSTAEGVACDERPTRWASRVHVTPAR